MSATSLLWRVFAANASILLVAAGLLVLTPLTISEQVVFAEVLIVLVGIGAMLAVDFILLRRMLTPLSTLTALMRSVDSLHPGRRLPVDNVSGAEVRALGSAFNSMLARLENEQHASRARALRAQEDERMRVARELHDQVGQTLTAVTIQAERAVSNPETADREALASIADAARHSLDDVRRIARDLRPEALDDLGLVNALIVLCRRIAEQSGVTIARHLNSPPMDLRPEVELVVYRIAQEAMTNAIRHAEPSRVELSLSTPGPLLLKVSDDGKGFQEDDRETVGLSGMRERALLVGGTLELRSAPGLGTTVVFAVPV